jgi:glycosyltransferase involved in cell wall biosynthesis
MRIGINAYLLQPTIGGLKQYFLTLFQELLLKHPEHEYILFWYPHNAGELARLSTDRWKERAIQLEHQGQVLLHLDQIDLYFCPFSALYPRPLPLPTVVTLVDIQEVFYPEFFTDDDRYNRERHFPTSTRMADRTITISEFSKQTLVQHHKLAPERVVVSYLSADERFSRAVAIARPPSLPLPDSFVFYPANFWKHKNHDCLLRALQFLRTRRSLTIHAVCTGFEQPNGYPLADKASEYGVRDQVHLLGHVEVEEMAYLYQHARMLVFPSLFEGFGIPLVEAMTVGCPIVAAADTSIPEIVGNAAELFDPASPERFAEAIERLWNDENRRAALVANGAVRSRAFSPSRTAQTHLLAFEQARQAYSRRRFLWNRWVYQYAQRAALEYRWYGRHREARHAAAAGTEG